MNDVNGLFFVNLLEDFSFDYVKLFPNIAGYSAKENFVVMECPDCFGKFYFHMYQSRIKLFMLQIRCKNKDYFRVPGVYEKILKMLEKQEKKQKKK